MSEKRLRQIWEKTGGHCHFCGDPLDFESYGSKGGDNHWVLDHVAQKGKGGSHSLENTLAACGRCNSLRWHRRGEEIRELLFLGLIAKDEIAKKSSAIGKKLIQLREKRLADNLKRRVLKDTVTPDTVVEAEPPTSE